MAEAMPDPPQLSWSHIPLDLAGLVLRRLPAHVDRVRFAAVCPQWRYAARQGLPLPRPLPLLALQDGTVYSLPSAEPFRLPACAGYTDACGGNWLFFSGEEGCFLRDPLSNATVTLPALSRVRLQYADDEARSLAWMDNNIDKDLDMRKVLFCSPHLIAALVWVRHLPRIALCKPGAASWWSVFVETQPAALFYDIAFHQGKLYGFDHIRSDLCAIDICVDNNTDDPSISGIRRVIEGTSIIADTLVDDFVVINTVYFVESSVALLMVKRGMYGIVNTASPDEEDGTVYPNGRNEFEVFQADFERSKWTELATIGLDQVLFLRSRCSRSVLVSQKEIPGNCIVFFENDDDEAFRYNTEMTSSSCSINNMKDGKMHSILFCRQCHGSVAQCLLHGSSRKTKVETICMQFYKWICTH
ncbi:hypothetical protein HU200_008748 [Digitaria exilis]|uniref:KIB1-4 beta-propeller domain-containing protein n=1 Tax=Digitaria exilis TaxID=1010633 RepID=A0A835FLM9_9POAL|nr:hypothetical protein HU200_008748 [Digitaria exilis]